MRKGKMDQEALRYHSEGRPGKIAVVPTKPYHTQHDLSLAYSPGVAAPCREIEANPEEVYRYTNKGNLVAVISNGTAVLGLGNIGALAGKPVMEGKSMLFKTYADIDAFDIEVDETDPEAFIRTVKAIAPTFGGINLEDIKAPECFEIDRRLSEELDIPVMHDDQHGTAVISTAAMLNAVKIAGKTLDKLRVVVNGAGAAAIACARLFIAVGVRRENMVFCDSRGVVTTYRTDINEIKREFATTRRITTLAEALHGADLFLGVSTADVLTPEMLRTMSTDPIVMALANPDPEIAYDKAVVSRPDIIFATGRSDYPNQVNNVLGFPYIFRGALDVRATKINEAMKLAAAHALAGLAQEPVPTMVLRAYALEKTRIRPRLPDSQAVRPAVAMYRSARRGTRRDRIGRRTAAHRRLGRLHGKTPDADRDIVPEGYRAIKRPGRKPGLLLHDDACTSRVTQTAPQTRRATSGARRNRRCL